MSGRGGKHRDDEIPTLYVRQVHYSARPDDLRALFERMGPVRDVYIPLDYYTRESRGFAYVKYEFTRDAEDALRKLNGASILGRRIEVEWAEGQRKTKTEMRVRDSYSSYHGRDRYYSRSPCKSEHGRSPRRRSRHRSRSYSRSKRRRHNSRRRSSSRHHYSNAKSRNSRSTRSSSSSVQKNHSKVRKIKRSKSPLISGSILRPLDEIKNQSDEEQDSVANEHSISNRQIADELKEAIIDELEVRSETRTSDTEIDERQIQKGVQRNESSVYLGDHVGVGIDGSNNSATEEEEEDKAVTDIEVVDEIIEQNGVAFDHDCPNGNSNVPEFLIADTTN